MKKLLFLLTILVTLCLSICATQCLAADGDIDEVRVIEDGVQLKVDKVVINFRNKSARITYREIDQNGNYTGKKVVRQYVNIVDDPDTPGDETDNQYNAMTREIVDVIVVRDGLGDAARPAFKKGVKAAYQLP